MKVDIEPKPAYWNDASSIGSGPIGMNWAAGATVKQGNNEAGKSRAERQQEKKEGSSSSRRSGKGAEM